MCKFCDPILGKGGLPHTESECALKQAAYCPLCSFGSHFRDQCPKKANRKLSHSLPTMKTSEAAIQPPSFVMSGKPSEYTEYLKKAGMPSKNKEDAERLVQEDLASRGMKLLTPPLTLYRSLPSTECACGLEHGANRACGVKK